MTVKELITLLMMQDPNAEIVMVDSGAPIEAWQDDTNWQGISGVLSAQDTTFYTDFNGGLAMLTANAVRLVGF